MKYSEFEKLMEDKGFYIEDFQDSVYVYAPINDRAVAVVFREHEGLIDLSWDSYIELPIETRKFIADKCMELSFTPPKDREDEEKYYYRLKGFQDSEYNAYLKYCTESLVIFISNDEREYYTYKSQFTETEFEALPDDIKSHNWEKIKVERED